MADTFSSVTPQAERTPVLDGYGREIVPMSIVHGNDHDYLVKGRRPTTQRFTVIGFFRFESGVAVQCRDVLSGRTTFKPPTHLSVAGA